MQLNLTEARTWQWRGHKITYQCCGDTGPAVVMVHGFGASWGHWRKNLPVIGQQARCYALDLIGFGGSDKPIPGREIDYTFATWSAQVIDFCREVVGEAAFLVGNSIGCIVVMQGAVDNPKWVRSLALINCSLRLLHERRRNSLPWYRSFGATVMQQVLGIQPLGQLFFQQLAQPKTVRRILLQAYRRSEAVTDELVEILMKPARETGAAAVFLAFTRYSQGPLPEDLLALLPCKALILWGSEDPWEPIEMGRDLTRFAAVQEFIALPGLGHCPQDEAPEIVNPILQSWLSESATWSES
ncbi:MAG: alpha/beta fold hydrolase [Jaaginema sp. PMC 1079.18]|nr:alpha/beta fold hydrolase [Jaaginema sp. PMC 1080.18]MEC4850721.1 alpha/beta fold hydrolase [Jaaginema sp. PMC 1079.18]MEC4867726.1 alpha/beta fold hydrolase [Jaaginema sp. PMC 1078.18]